MVSVALPKLKGQRLFWVVSLALILSDTAFIAINYHSAKSVLDEQLNRQGAQFRETFDLSVRQTALFMQQVATFVAHDRVATALFAEGVRAVHEEGGGPGPGGEQAALLRERLFRHLEASWRAMHEQYDIRQLHYHLAPGSHSYLRVHKPGRFGDDMSDLRHIIATVNDTLEPAFGFESGRIYAGIRGVVALFEPGDDGQPGRHIGALEAGTSFNHTLDNVREVLGIDVAVLMTMDHARATMWPDLLRQFMREHRANDDFLVDSTTSEQAIDLVALPEVADLYQNPGTRLVRFGGRDVAVTGFQLRDFAGQRDPARTASGLVLGWFDATGMVAGFRQGVWTNIVYGVVGFLVVESLLFWLWAVGTRRLVREIDIATVALREQVAERDKLAKALEHAAHTDALTQIANRRHFYQFGERALNYARRKRHPLSLLMIDVDLFKDVNDQFGHPVGDEVLRVVARRCVEVVREYDLVARIGGEEFACILTESSEDEAIDIAERLRVALKQPLPTRAGELRLTVSVGLATTPDGADSLEVLMSSADQALYTAKRGGRDRISVWHMGPVNGD